MSIVGTKRQGSVTLHSVQELGFDLWNCLLDLQLIPTA